MLKKCFHNHYFFQTNLEIQCKSKTEPRTQPPGKLAHTKLLQQQPKENSKDTTNPILPRTSFFCCCPAFNCQVRAFLML